MKFEEALPYLRQGMKIKRREGEYSYELEKDDLECGWEFTLGDLNGEWEVIEQILTTAEKDTIMHQMIAFDKFDTEIISLVKIKDKYADNRAYIEFQLKCRELDCFSTYATPTFNAGEKFVGMKFNKNYTLKELEINV